MTDTNKYYTPEIEDIHIGMPLEFCYYNYPNPQENHWIPMLLDIHHLQILHDDKASSVRVRHLCHDDMEDCGFTLISSDRYDFQDDWRIHSLMKNNSADYYRIGNHEAFFREGEENDFSMVMIDGLRFTLKSKSDLKRLMKQWGYETA